jgi:hypothetical protein
MSGSAEESEAAPPACDDEALPIGLGFEEERKREGCGAGSEPRRREEPGQKQKPRDAALLGERPPRRGWRTRHRRKANRGPVFARWLLSTFGAERLRAGSGVADICGGKGELAFSLTRRGVPATVVDRRAINLARAKRGFVRAAGDAVAAAAATAASAADDPAEASAAPSEAKGALPADPPQLVCDFPTNRAEADALARAVLQGDEAAPRWTALARLLRSSAVLVGLHADEATEAIVDVALATRKPFAVVPCCVFARYHRDRALSDGAAVRSYDELVAFLLSKAPRVVRVAELGFEGRNLVLFSLGNEGDLQSSAQSPATG